MQGKLTKSRVLRGGTGLCEIPRGGDGVIKLLPLSETGEGGAR